MFLRLECGERGFEVVFEGAGDEAVFGFADVVLPARALGLIPGALDREALEPHALVVRGLERLERVRGGVDPGGRDGLQERGSDGAVDAERAEALARPARALLLEGA